MKYCKICGKEMFDHETLCSSCGNGNESNSNTKDLLWALLGFFSSFFGLFFAFILKNKHKEISELIYVGSLYSICLTAMIYIYYLIFLAIM